VRRPARLQKNGRAHSLQRRPARSCCPVRSAKLPRELWVGEKGEAHFERSHGGDGGDDFDGIESAAAKRRLFAEPLVRQEVRLAFGKDGGVREGPLCDECTAKQGLERE